MDCLAASCSSSLQGFKSLQELFQGEIRRSAKFYDPLLPVKKTACHFRHTVSDIKGNREDAVTIAMQKITGSNLQTTHFHGAAGFEDVRKGMRNRNISRKHLEPSRVDSGQITDGAVGHEADAAQCQKYVRVDFANERASPRLMVDITHHDDPRFRNLQDVIPPVGSVVKVLAINGRHGSANERGCRVADHRMGKIFKHAPNACIGKSRVAWADAKRFNRI